MRVLVTGGAGFIGSLLVDRLGGGEIPFERERSGSIATCASILPPTHFPLWQKNSTRNHQFILIPAIFRIFCRRTN